MVVAAPNDAITGSALAMRGILREHGGSEIFALHVHPELADNVYSWRDYPYFIPADSDPITMVHVSMGDDNFLPFLAEIPGRFVISYHNVTPSRYFKRWDAGTARLLDIGRRYLRDLRDRVVFALADSEFNASDLRDAGYSDVRVGGLVLDIDRHLTATEPGALPDVGDGPLILSVGQLYPHKRPDLLLAAFHTLITDFQHDAHLVLAGAARLPAFERALCSYVGRLGLGDAVTMTREIPDAELVAWFRRADLFVTVSEHEGFCVPLVEAMYFDVPILARNCAAIPETVGDAAILVPEGANANQIAAVMSEMLDRPGALASLVERGRMRRTEFTYEASRRKLWGALGEGAACS
jgi:L-malate glycosyltransferase